MKFDINFLCLGLLVTILTLSQLKCICARSLVSPTFQLANSANAKGTLKKHSTIYNQTSQNVRISHNYTLQNDSMHNNPITEEQIKQVTNKTNGIVKQPEIKLLEIKQPAESTVVAHILRRKRETVVAMPFDFNTLHLPCDLDQNSRSRIIDSFPNHCIWVWNNKYVHEGFYRVYKTYQLEAFFFGQYYERLKRFEIDPHSWDYGDTGV